MKDDIKIKLKKDHLEVSASWGPKEGLKAIYREDHVLYLHEKPDSTSAFFCEWGEVVTNRRLFQREKEIKEYQKGRIYAKAQLKSY